jgi:hypothetical protein
MKNDNFNGKIEASHNELDKLKQDTAEDSAHLKELLIETLAETMFEENRRQYRDLFENVPTGYIAQLQTVAFSWQIPH